MKAKPSPATAAELSESLNPENPRRLSPERRAKLARSIEEMGDLGGIVRNVRTGHIVGGNQRTAVFGNDPDAKVVVTERFDKPSRAGTVAVGYVMAAGERFSYREVSWTIEKERLAMIAANAQGGEFDPPALATILDELKAAGADLNMTGLEGPDIDKLLNSLEPPMGNRKIGNLSGEVECPSCAFRFFPKRS